MRARRIRREKFLIPAVFAFTMVAVFMTTYYMEVDNGAVAADLSKFDAGKIISDYQMSNSSSMTEDEIQAFLTQKNSCKNKNKALYDEMMERYSPRYTWHFKDDHFVCLSEEKFGDGEVFGEEGTETAAHIIWQAAQDYQINPQVLIVLLQKEQGLITDTYPNSIQYRSATGYGCPDTAACSSKYYGFKNQVRNAAAMFHTVLTGGWTNYPVGKNYVQYNPNPDCGGSEVDIKNRATSALYRYTPYQPSAAALAAGYGTVECGAYGNRNFYLYFEDWFGGILDEAPAETEELSATERAAESAISERASKATILGELKTPELKETYNGGYYKEYAKGYIYWTESTGAWDISGGILSLWKKMDKEEGILGYPLSSEKVNDRGEVYQEFEHGKIYWTAKKGAWLIRDFANVIWDGLGGSKSKLGNVTYNGNCGLTKDGCYQAFATGVIIGNETTGYFDVSGGIKDYWYKNGAEWGILGYPLSSEKVNDRGEVYQEFEHGKIYWTAIRGAWSETSSS